MPKGAENRELAAAGSIRGCGGDREAQNKEEAGGGSRKTPVGTSFCRQSTPWSYFYPSSEGAEYTFNNDALDVALTGSQTLSFKTISNYV